MHADRRVPSLAAAGSAVGACLVALVASVPGSPFQPALPAGVRPAGPFASLASGIGLDRLHGDVLVGVGAAALVGATAAFLWLLFEAWNGRVSLATVLALAVAYHAIVLTLPVLFSRDVYSYALYGRIAGIYHANPYVQTPADFPHDAFARLVGPKWFHTPAVYGPAFTALSAGLSRGIRSVQGTVEVFRLAAVTASLGTVTLIAGVARRLRPDKAAFAAAAFGANPVVVFQSAASAHNDLLVALAVAGAFALVVARKELAAVAVLTLGTLVKATAALPLALLIVWCVARRPAGRRARALASHAGLAVLIGAAFAAPFLQLRDPSLGMLELAGHEGWLAPSRFFRRAIDAVSANTLGIVARVGFALLLAASVALVAREVWRRAVDGHRPGGEDARSWIELGSAWGWALLLLTLLGPVLLPWYVTWSLPLAWLLPRVPRAVLLAVSSAVALSQWTSEPARFERAYDANVLVGHYLITPVVIALLLWLAIDLRRRLVLGLSLGDEQEVAGAAGEDRRDRRAEARGEA